MKVTVSVLLAAMALTTASAFADGLQGVEADSAVTHSGKDLSGNLEFDRSISAEVDRVWTQMDPVTVTIPCTGSDAWNNYFTDPRTQKPTDLVNAIQGLSIVDARVMAYNNFFATKPASWDEFSAEINRYDSMYNKDVASAVLNTYGQANEEALGYDSSQTCTGTQMQPVEHKEFYQERARNFHVIIHGGALLTGESEQINLSYDGFKDGLTISSAYNNYAIESRQEEGNTVVYVVTETRVQVDPANTLAVSASDNGGELMLNVTDNGYDPDLGASAGQTVVVMDFRQVGFLGISHSIGTVEKTVNLTNQQMTIDTGLKAPQGKKIFINVSLKRENSPYFNGNASSHIETNKVQF